MAEPADPFEGLPAVRRAQRIAATTTPHRGTVFFCHGLGLYAAKFDALFLLLTGLGYDVVTHDIYGHGECSHDVRHDRIDAMADASVDVYRRVESERPILLAVGMLGGFVARKITQATRGSAWVPPAVWYSVDYAKVPPRMRRALQRPALLSAFDRVRVSYDYRSLTSDAASNQRFIDDDPLAWRHVRFGAALKMANEVNGFYDLPHSDEGPLAIIVGDDEAISHTPPVLRAGKRQPNHRLWSVPGGRTHLHRDRADVREAFARALDEALCFVTEQAQQRGPEATR